MMKFTKMHGLGNDYIYVDLFQERVDDPAGLARRISNRHTGVGGDGLILIGPSREADVRMEMYNADGSRSEMCGNGIRCVAKYAIEHGLASGPDLRIETDAGTRHAMCESTDERVETVRIDMGVPSLDPFAIGFVPDRPSSPHPRQLVDFPIEVDGTTYRMTCVSIGNPHAVVFVENLHRVDLVDIGPRFEHSPHFPKRINAHFVRVDADNKVTVRTWERGSGATRACGTGACAVCVAGAVSGRTARKITATLPGGNLEIEWSGDDHIYMTGPAIEVFSGDWTTPSSD
jgi:diaminopimelate epimerase